NVPEIREFFWKWRRHHYPQTEHSLAHYFHQLLKPNETAMGDLGIFGHSVVEELEDTMGEKLTKNGRAMSGVRFGGGGGGLAKSAAPMAAAPAGRGGGLGGAPAEGKEAADSMKKDDSTREVEEAKAKNGGGKGLPEGAPGVEPTIRKNFA